MDPSTIHKLDGTVLTTAEIKQMQKDGVCFNCFQAGHIASTCPRAPKRDSKGNLMR